MTNAAIPVQKFFLYASRMALIVWLLLTLWPVSYGVTRLAQVVLFFVGLISLTVVWYQRRWVRWGVACLVFGCIATLLLPERAISTSRLRERYVRELERLDGTRYVWGGENGLGIDCSGLVRRAMVRALMQQGIQTFNAGLIRRGAALWWYDSSARALADEYQDGTKRLFDAESIIDHQNEGLLPGDLAVTSGGVHVLAYLGDHQWIEADPGIRKVVRLSTEVAEWEVNGWLRTPVQFVRWRVLLK